MSSWSNLAGKRVELLQQLGPRPRTEPPGRRSPQYAGKHLEPFSPRHPEGAAARAPCRCACTGSRRGLRSKPVRDRSSRPLRSVWQVLVVGLAGEPSSVDAGDARDDQHVAAGRTTRRSRSAVADRYLLVDRRVLPRCRGSLPRDIGLGAGSSRSRRRSTPRSCCGKYVRNSLHSCAASVLFVGDHERRLLDRLDHSSHRHRLAGGRVAPRSVSERSPPPPTPSRERRESPRADRRWD